MPLRVHELANGRSFFSGAAVYLPAAGGPGVRQRAGLATFLRSTPHVSLITPRPRSRAVRIGAEGGQEDRQSRHSRPRLLAVQ